MSNWFQFTCPKCGHQFAAVGDRSAAKANQPTFRRSFLGFLNTCCPNCATAFAPRLATVTVVVFAIAAVPLLPLMAFYAALFLWSDPMRVFPNWSGWVMMAFMVCVSAAVLTALIRNFKTGGKKAVRIAPPPDAPAKNEPSHPRTDDAVAPTGEVAMTAAQISCESCGQSFIGSERPGGLCPLCGRPVRRAPRP